MIPKIIHQTWKNEEIPEEWVKAVQSCKDKNHNFEYKLWTDKKMLQFVKEEYPNLLELYNSYDHPIQRCDVFRYLVLYKYGGVYLDMDIGCKKSLEELLHYDLVLAKSFNYETFTNMFFMSSKGNPFIKYCIDNLIYYKDKKKLLGNHLHIMYSTGPFYLDKMVKLYKKENIKNFYIVTKKEFAGDCTVCNEHICKGGEYFKHYKGQSWNGIDSKFFNYISCYYPYILILSILLLLLIFFFIKEKF